MSTYVNLVETQIECNALDFYRLIAVPDNWPRFHPVTSAVFPITGSTAEVSEVGTVFGEQIKRPDHLMEARWEVTLAEPGRTFVFRSMKFGDLPVVMTISYRLEQAGELTKVERFMRTDVLAGQTLPRETAIHFSLPDVHEKFLAILANHLESGPSPDAG